MKVRKPEEGPQWVGVIMLVAFLVIQGVLWLL